MAAKGLQTHRLGPRRQSTIASARAMLLSGQAVTRPLPTRRYAMTPPSAASQVARRSGLALRPASDSFVLRMATRLVDVRAWSRLRLLVDVVVLYLAASAALFASTPIRVVSADRWLAALFPIVVIAILQVWRTPDERLAGSLLDTTANVFRSE